MKLTKTQQEILRQKQFIPDGIQGDEIYTPIKITTNAKEMRKKKGEIRIGYFNSKKNKIKILLGNEMDKALLEEWLHAVFFANGFREELGKLEEPLIRLMGRAFRQYLSACQLNYLKIQEVKCQKKK